MKKYLTLALSSILIVLLIQACSPKKEVAAQDTNTDIIPVKIINLGKTSVQPTLQVSGQLTTDDETFLSFKTGGVIRSINVKEGDAIRKGQLLASLDLTEIKAQVAQARLNLEKSQRDFSRIERLHKDSVATLEQLQNSQTSLAISQQQFDAASFNLGFSEIRALKDGFVLKKFVSEGQVITSGTSVFQTNGAGSAHWILRCAVSDRDWAAVSLKDLASITFDAVQGTYQSMVTRKSEGADNVTGSFSVELTLAETPKNMATGMFGKATISPKLIPDSFTIPYDALLDGDGGDGYVFITADNKTAKKVEVKIGRITRDQVQILSGLTSGTSLIVSGNAYLTDKALISIIP